MKNLRNINWLHRTDKNSIHKALVSNIDSKCRLIVWQVQDGKRTTYSSYVNGLREEEVSLKCPKGFNKQNDFLYVLRPGRGQLFKSKIKSTGDNIIVSFPEVIFEAERRKCPRIDNSTNQVGRISFRKSYQGQGHTFKQKIHDIGQTGVSILLRPEHAKTIPINSFVDSVAFEFSKDNYIAQCRYIQEQGNMIKVGLQILGLTTKDRKMFYHKIIRQINS